MKKIIFSLFASTLLLAAPGCAGTKKSKCGDCPSFTKTTVSSPINKAA